MSKYITLGTITAALSVGAIIAGAFGKTTLQSYLANPETAQTLLTVIGSIGTLIAGLLPGVKS
jgi:hypothetical protein